MPDINKSYAWSIATCNAPKVQYSQEANKRWGNTVNGITYYDCSSFIYFALKAGGFPVPSGSWYTGDMIPPILEMGFIEVPLTGEWKKGDIGWMRRGDHGHTEMVYEPVGVGGGYCMGAHGRVNRAPDEQVSISDYVSYASRWDLLLRYGEGADGGYGYSFAVIASLCGNCWQESTINPTGVEVGGTGFGLFQWSNTATSDRRARFEAWCLENGYDKNDGYIQLQYLLEENFWIPKTGFTEFQSLSDWFNSTSTDIAYLTEAFMRCWEIPNEAYANLANRIEKANLCYQYYLNHANDTTIIEWKTTPNYLIEEDSLNNAILIFRYFSSGGGGGGTPTEENKHLPIWMYPKKKGVIIQWQ